MITVDLFAGCGGLSLGFIQAGFRIVAAYDNWDPAIATYKANIKTHPIHKMDLSDTRTAVAHISPFHPEVLIGGPPCQDFSHAGKRIEGNRADLTTSFVDIACAVAPSWVVMENVDRIAGSRAYQAVRSKLNDSGYGLTEYIFNASLCGVPQRRKRFFCIAHFGDTREFLLPSITAAVDHHLPMTVRQYFGDSLGINYYYRHPRNYNRRGVFSVDEPSPTLRGVNRPIPEGYPGHPRDPVKIDATVRPLTTAERARIQTFPPDYKWIGNKTETEQMIGNAVPVRLAEFVARLILEYRPEGVRPHD